MIAGSTFNVSYTVTNLGSGPTLVDDWTDSVWLTRDKTRPIPAQGDILLTQVTHTGGLALDAGYDQTLSVTLPDRSRPGHLLHHALDRPVLGGAPERAGGQRQSGRPQQSSRATTTRRAQIDVLAPLPDLVVTSITAPASGQGRRQHQRSTGPSTNIGNGVAQPTGLDRHRLPDQRPHQSARPRTPSR